MSNKLKKKSKQVQVGFSKTDIEQIKSQSAKKQSEIEVVTNTYRTLQKMSLFIVRDLFGYGKIRLGRFEDGMYYLLDENQKGTIKIQTDLKELLKTKYGLDVVELSAKIPFRQKLTLARIDFPTNPNQATMTRKLVNRTYESWVTTALFSLLVTMDVSVPGAKSFITKLYEYIENYTMGLLTSSDIDSFLELLFEECGYKAKESI